MAIALQTGTLHLIQGISIKQGGTYRLALIFMQSTGIPMNFEGCTAIAQIRRAFSSANATDFLVTFDPDRASGKLTLSLSPVQTAALVPGKYEWDLFIDFLGGDRWPALEGDVVVRARVSVSNGS